VKTYVLDFDRDRAPIAVDERELAQFYAATSPPGGPPLDEVREHVIAALRRTKESALAVTTSKLDLHLLHTLDDFIELNRGGPKELAGTRFWTATEAVEHLTAVRRCLEDVDPVRLPEDLLARTVAQLVAACDAIRTRGAPVRLAEAPHAMSLDEQVAVLASAGITARPGTTRAQLTANYDEDEVAARPWECLFDFSEHSDHLVDLALKCIETEEDRDAYARVVTTFAKLARGRFPAEHVSGDIDFEAKVGFVELTLDGERHRINAAFRGEWLDTDVLAELDRLLGERADGWGFYGLEGDGEGRMTIATDRGGYLRLRAAGAPFRSLGRVDSRRR
jgi:hypothetical protein